MRRGQGSSSQPCFFFYNSFFPTHCSAPLQTMASRSDQGLGLHRSSYKWSYSVSRARKHYSYFHSKFKNTTDTIDWDASDKIWSPTGGRAKKRHDALRVGFHYVKITLEHVACRLARGTNFIYLSSPPSRQPPRFDLLPSPLPDLQLCEKTLNRATVTRIPKACRRRGESCHGCLIVVAGGGKQRHDSDLGLLFSVHTWRLTSPSPISPYPLRRRRHGLKEFHVSNHFSVSIAHEISLLPFLVPEDDVHGEYPIQKSGRTASVQSETSRFLDTALVKEKRGESY
ncbi:hypothetical protein V8G54_025612 [Vigna mungo]|uniref:Uncharacterized protein n=1 Tax=Vigna mungo TaxID=3915 RepID=A0AAQ3MY41_VIGMU